MAKRYYTNDAVDKLVDRYIDKGGQIETVTEAVLACYGLAILYGDKLKTCIIREVYLNAWSSTNSVIFYNKMPKKYQSLINQ